MFQPRCPKNWLTRGSPALFLPCPRFAVYYPRAVTERHQDFMIITHRRVTMPKSQTNRPSQIEVTRTYVQMTSPSQLAPSRVTDQSVRLDRVHDCPASFHRYLYVEVGRHYHWVDRLGWTDSQIRAYLNTPGLSLWLMTYRGAPAGYFELQHHEDGSVEIAYFGLLQEFLGRGLGRHLLTCAVEQAWADGANRVWLHTCTLDDPAALPNYLKRGFTPFKEEQYITSVAGNEHLKVAEEQSR